MAVRARLDNLSLEHPTAEGSDAFDFDELWQLRHDLRTASHRIVGDAEKAHDVVQDTFLRVLSNAERLHRRSSFAPWLATVARRRSIDEIRARSRVRSMPIPPEPTSAASTDPLDHVLRQEAIDRVRGALDTLSPKERRLLLRQVTHELSLAELADEEATTVASVRSALSRARTKLRAAVEREGPLGVAPMPGLVAAFRRRMHRWVSRIDGRMPFAAAAAAPFSDAVVAGIAVVALLLGSTVGAPASQAVTTRLATSDAPASPSSSSAPAPAGEDDPTPSRPGDKPGTSTTSTSTTTVPQVGLTPPWEDVPTLPVDGYDSPDDVQVSSFATTSDRRTVFATGKNVNNQDVVLRSADNGATWHRLPIPKGAKKLLVPPTYPTEPTLFLVDESPLVLLRSDDHGAHFHPVAPARGGVALAPDYAVSKRVLLAGNPILEYRADTPTGSVRPLLATPHSAEVGAIAIGWRDGNRDTILIGGTSVHGGSTRGSAVYACSSTFCSEHATLPGMQLAPMLHRSTSAPGTVFAWQYHQVLWSSDEGRTFAPTDLPPFNVNAFVDGAPGEVFVVGQGVGGGPGVHRSTDGGRSWRAIAGGTPLASGARAMARLASGRLLAATLTGTGIHCSENDGRTWSTSCN